MSLRRILSPLLYKRIGNQLFRQSRRGAHTSEEDDRDLHVPKGTHLNLLNDPDIPFSHLYINHYSSEGFELSTGIALKGSIIFFPRSFLSWKVKNIREVTEESMLLFKVIYPKLDLLIIGTGSKKATVSPELVKFLRENKINFEILPTGKAIPTFNFLSAEQRWVAAALIPPSTVEDSLTRDIKEHLEAQDELARLDGDEEDDIALIGDDDNDDIKVFEHDNKPREQIPNAEQTLYNAVGVPEEKNMFGYKIDYPKPLGALPSPLEEHSDLQPQKSKKSGIRYIRKSDYELKKDAAKGVPNVRSPLEVRTSTDEHVTTGMDSKIVSKPDKSLDNVDTSNTDKTEDKQ